MSETVRVPVNLAGANITEQYKGKVDEVAIIPNAVELNKKETASSEARFVDQMASHIANETYSNLHIIQRGNSFAEKHSEASKELFKAIVEQIIYAVADKALDGRLDELEGENKRFHLLIELDKLYKIPGSENHTISGSKSPIIKELREVVSQFEASVFYPETIDKSYIDIGLPEDPAYLNAINLLYLAAQEDRAKAKEGKEIIFGNRVTGTYESSLAPSKFRSWTYPGNHKWKRTTASPLKEISEYQEGDELQILIPPDADPGWADQYRTAMQTLLHHVQELSTTHRGKLNELIVKEIAELQELMDQVNNEPKEEDIETLQNSIEKLRKDIADAEQTISVRKENVRHNNLRINSAEQKRGQLGFFAFARKRELDQEIRNEETEISSANTEIGLLTKKIPLLKKELEKAEADLINLNEAKEKAKKARSHHLPLKQGNGLDLDKLLSVQGKY